jgi:hypothetical protein
MTKVIFLKNRSNSKGQRVKVIVSNQRPYHKEYTCDVKYESPSTEQSKVMTKVKVLMNGQTE